MFEGSRQRKRIIFLICMIIFGCVFSLIYLALLGNTDQVYNELILSDLSYTSGNKTVERNLLFLLIFIGLLAYFVYCIFLEIKCRNLEKEINQVNQNEKNKTKEFLCVFITMSIAALFVLNRTYTIVAVSLVFVLILYVLDREIVLPGICTFYLCVYAIVGLYRLYVFCGGENAANDTLIAVFGLTFSLLPLLFKNKRKTMIKVAMLASVIVPCVLLFFLSNKYYNESSKVIISVPKEIQIVIWMLIIIFVVEAVFKLIRQWKCAGKIDDVITFGSCVAILAFNRYDGTGAIMSTDLHHPFENIIGYSQVFHLGQVPFKDYIPVSGMYSIVQGAVFDFFGDGGTFANYHVTDNLFYLFVIILIVALLKKHLDGKYLLLLSLIFYMPTYNRLVFMLPIMLILIWPKLISKKNLWLMTWFLTSLFQGLYYPLYGVATCVAFAPLGIWQVVTYVRNGELRKDIKKISFWIGWIICVVIFIASLDFLSGTLKHMLALSNQSLLADGLSRFGQTVPGDFFPYLQGYNAIVRIGLYYGFTIMIPVAFVWIAFALVIKVADISFEGKRIRVGNVKIACIMSSLVIMPIICYTFTFTRMDAGSLYARNAGVLFAGVVILLIFTWNYLKDEKTRLWLIAFAIFIPVVARGVGIFSIDSNSKLSAAYSVPEGYIYVENDAVEKLGTGFIEQSIYDDIEKSYQRFSDKDSSLSYMGDPTWFGHFYLLDVRGDGSMELASTVKSLAATEETVDIARENRSIIAPSFIPFFNYYLYHWLLSSGEYIWDEEIWEFIPNDGSYTREEILEKNKNNNIAYNDMDVGKTASSWGSSMDSLDKLFTEPKMEYDLRREGNSVVISFSESFDGDEADFIYLEFENMEENYGYVLYDSNVEIAQENNRLANHLMKKNYNPGMTLQLRWSDDNGEIHTMNCNMGKGKLLIPVGGGWKWLLNQHEYVSISVYQDGQEIDAPELVNARFLKLREAH